MPAVVPTLRFALAAFDCVGDGESVGVLVVLALDEDGVPDEDVGALLSVAAGAEPALDEFAGAVALPSFAGDMAFCRNWSNGLSGEALTAKTMPCWQWLL